MKTLSDDEWAGLSSLLDEALELDPPERGAWLDRLRAHNPTRAQRIADALDVQSDEDFADFLRGPSPLLAAEVDAATLPGQRIGQYTVEAEIGRGAMGSVWRASRADGRFESLAVIKLVHAAWVGESGRARFRKQGRLLASLEHPHIARVLDADVLEGTQPYLILEFVDGEPLDAYCNRQAPSLEARLDKFLDVLAAVGYGHNQLIVHRDLKLANIFVARDGSVKVLDFGVSALLDGEAGTTLTQAARSALMPMDAAPEQLSGKPVTVASDVYALGLVLYQLLTGVHPVAAAMQRGVDVLDAVQTLEPVRASAAAMLGGIRASAVRGDLDAILSKALHKVPGERYESVGAFAADLRRHLAHEPVAARRDLASYRAQKFLRRHRLAAGMVLLGVLAVAVAVAVCWTQLRVARGERQAAIAAGRRAVARDRFATLILDDLSKQVPPQALQSSLERARGLLDKQQYDDPTVKATLLESLATRYRDNGDPVASIALLEEALGVLKTVDDPRRTLQLNCAVAKAYDALGRVDDAQRQLHDATGLLERQGLSSAGESWADCGALTTSHRRGAGANPRHDAGPSPRRD